MSEQEKDESQEYSTARIYNTTRYYTEDIEKLAVAIWGTWYRPTRLTVVYYAVNKAARASYAKDGGKGLFVKMLRNGDEHESWKNLRIIRPTRFDGISELEQIAASGSGSAPLELVRQVLRRLDTIRKYAGLHRPSWQVQFFSRRETAQLNELIEEHQLRLRFHTNEPLPSVLAWREQLISHAASFRLAQQDLQTLERAIEEVESKIETGQARLAVVREQKTIHENRLTQAQVNLRQLLQEGGGNCL